MWDPWEAQGSKGHPGSWICRARIGEKSQTVSRFQEELVPGTEGLMHRGHDCIVGGWRPRTADPS